MTANNSTKKTTDDDWFGELLVGFITLTGKGLWRFALRWPDTATLLTIFVLTGMFAGLRVACVLTGMCAALVWGWRLGWPESYQRLIGKPVADYRRAHLVYRRRWRVICERHGLTIAQRGKPDADPLVPDLSAVRVGAAVDTLVVRLLVGQSVKTWQTQVDGLAVAFGAHHVTIQPGRVATGRGRDIVLRVRHHDALAAPIPLARPCPDSPVVRLANVPVGVTEQGNPRLLPVAGRHILVAGLAPGIKAGLIAVRCLDPKGGMEFGAAAALFDRFAYDSESILEVLRDTTATMLARAQRLRGTTRCHRPSRAEPHIVLLVDELATLTAYADRKQRAEVDQLLGLWLAQGRAVGVSVIAAVQDPSKDVVALRQLFPVRVGLRMTEATQTAMILSTSAHQLGARCEEIHLGRRVAVMIRCGNRRAAICPSCSDLYAADTWQLVHAGAQGGHHGMPETTVDRPQVFATLTAPSFGAVHTSSHRPGQADTVCHPGGSGKGRCPHGKPPCCNVIHASDDPEVGQPLCVECYDYTGHVLFNWHAPELWWRFTIALRRAVTAHLRRIGADPDALRVSFVKVAEYQSRAVVHYHALIRLDRTSDGTEPTISSIDLATLVRQAAHQVRLSVTADNAVDIGVTAAPEAEPRMLRFGVQIDTQPLTAPGDASKPALARRVAGYLAKYTTKSVAEFGIAARRISPAAIAELDIPAHTRRILSTLAELATRPGNTAMLGWLHTLGYRGHITTKSRRYSTTVTALRAARRHWRTRRADQPEHDDCQHNSHDQQDLSNRASELSDWRVDGVGHRNDGERLLVHSAALRAREHRYLARLDASHNSGAGP